MRRYARCRVMPSMGGGAGDVPARGAQRDDEDRQIHRLRPRTRRARGWTGDDGRERPGRAARDRARKGEAVTGAPTRSGRCSARKVAWPPNSVTRRRTSSTISRTLKGQSCAHSRSDEVAFHGRYPSLAEGLEQVTEQPRNVLAPIRRTGGKRAVKPSMRARRSPRNRPSRAASIKGCWPATMMRDVHGHGTRLSDRVDLALLEDPQELRLQGQRAGRRPRPAAGCRRQRCGTAGGRRSAPVKAPLR